MITSNNRKHLETIRGKELLVLTAWLSPGSMVFKKIPISVQNSGYRLSKESIFGID